MTDFTISGANGLPPYDHNETWLGDENNSRLNRNSQSGKNNSEVYFNVKVNLRNISLEQYESLVINQQPQPSTQNTRASMPVYTAEWSSVPYGHIIPMTGLDFLIGVPEVVIQQTIEDCKFCLKYFINLDDIYIIQ